MSKQKKILLAIIIALVVSIGILAYIQGKKKAELDKLVNGSDTEPAPLQPNNINNNISDFPIVYNKYSEAAKLLQRVLGVVDDGIFGAKSLAALQKYYPTYNKDFSINNRATLEAMIAKISTQKKAEQTQTDTSNNNLNRAKGIFEAVKKQGKVLLITTSHKAGVGVIDYQGVWTKTSNDVTLPSGTRYNANRLLTYSKNFLHVSKDGQGKVLLIKQEYCIAQ